MSSSSQSSSGGECRQISLDAIKDATNNFAESNVLGHGGEGKVYLAKIKFGWKLTQVAVKHLKPNSQEFEKEIKTISKIQHPNLVSLLGYCDESGQKILLYEYMEKGSLADYVRKKSKTTLSWASWPQRIRICLDAARGLQHLHIATNENPKGIIHRDVKPDNILLGKDWVAKISDFGMFKLSHAGQVKSTMVTGLKGTGGYYAPEYIRYQSVTRKIDVYAFGVVLFEVLCLKMPWDRGDESYYGMEDEDLGIWAHENVDPTIKQDISDDSLKEFTSIVGKTLKSDPRKRPTMDGVVLGLEKVLKSVEKEDEAMKGRASKESTEHSTAGSRRGASSVVSETIAEHEYNRSIVLDIGGGITKAGFAGEDDPEVVFASGIGRPKNNGGNSTTYIGKDLASYTGEIISKNPVKDGIVVSWADYEKVLHHTLYNELDYDPENKHPVFLTEPPLRHNATDGERKEYKTNRENMVDVMFDKFDVPALYIGIQPVLSLISSGRTTGLVIESGEDVSHSVPIYEGHVLPHAITSLKYAGRGITDHMIKILNEERDYNFNARKRDLVMDMKEKMAYIALNYKTELRKSKKMNKNYTLPDGKIITIGQELFQCPEALFDPSIVGSDEPGIHENTYDSLMLCNEEIRDELSHVIVLGGGSTMLTGFSERMEKEVRGLASSGTNIKITADPNRNYSAWTGGSIMASLSSFQKMWITRKEYEEHGLSIVHKKCF